MPYATLNPKPLNPKLNPLASSLCLLSPFSREPETLSSARLPAETP